MAPVQTIIIGVAVGIVIPASMLCFSLWTFTDGTLAQRNSEEYTWGEHWQALGIVAIIVAMGAFLYELLWNRYGLFTAIRWEIAAGLAVLVAWSDIKSKLIPNPMILIAVVSAVLISLFEVLFGVVAWQACLATALFGVVSCAGVLIVSRIVTRGGVGFGDIKLFISLGLLLGLRGCINVLIYTMLVAFVAAIVMLITRKKTLHDNMPLAPFVLIGIVVSILFGA